MFPTEDGLAILLTYGPGGDWQKNLDSAGGGKIRHYGKTHSYTGPRMMTKAEAAQSVTGLCC